MNKKRLVEVLAEEGALHAREVGKIPNLGWRWLRRFRGGLIEFSDETWPGGATPRKPTCFKIHT